MQHEGATYLGHDIRRYHFSLFPNDITLHDFIIIANNKSICIATPGEGTRADEGTADGRNEEVPVDVGIVRD